MSEQVFNYVKFLRGTPKAYQELAIKDDDTLYFIAETDASVGKIYLGRILVASGVASDGTNVVNSLSQLIDVNVANLQSGQVLVYNGEEWVPTSLPEAVVSSMSGATADKSGSAGLVPAPQAGDHNKFLRGDGTWAEVTGGNVDLTNYVTQEEFDVVEEKIKEIEEDQNDMQDSFSWGTI